MQEKPVYKNVVKEVIAFLSDKTVTLKTWSEMILLLIPALDSGKILNTIMNY